MSVAKEQYTGQTGASGERRRFLARIELLSANRGASGRGRQILEAGGLRRPDGRPRSTAADGR